MVKVRNDLTGKVFGRLTVIEQAEDYVDPNGKHIARWLCECSCCDKTKVIVTGGHLTHGDITSCGCYQKEVTSINKKKYNKFSDKLYDEHGEYYIGLASNTGTEFYVDADDFDKIKQYCWAEGIRSGFHVLQSKINGKMFLMHQFLGFKYYDHIDRNQLNNRKYNLRQCTPQENGRNCNLASNNTSGITGVYWSKRIQKWIAQIGINWKKKYLGCFVSKEDAIKARLIAEKEYFGEFAPQKNLFDKYNI